ncbi:MAG: phasin family protein [Gammaproteobacteria bacterium]
MAKDNGSSVLLDNQVARVMKDSVHQVWLAGLGACARAEAEGSRLFDNLVTLGERIENGARSRVGRRVDAAQARMNGARENMADAWDRFEQLVQYRVARALNGLQIPTARDVRELNRRVEELQEAVARLSTVQASPAARKRTTSRAGGSRKTARKAPARRKASAGRKTGRRKAG